MDVDSDSIEFSKNALEEGAAPSENGVASDDESDYSGVTNEDLDDDGIDEDFDNDNDVSDGADTSDLEGMDWQENVSVKEEPLSPKEEPLSPKEEPLSDASEAYDDAALYDNGGLDNRESGWALESNSFVKEEEEEEERGDDGASSDDKVLYAKSRSTKAVPVVTAKSSHRSAAKQVRKEPKRKRCGPRVHSRFLLFHCYYCPIIFKKKFYLSAHVLNHLEKGDPKFEVADSTGKRVHPAYLEDGQPVLNPGKYVRPPVKKKGQGKLYKCHLCDFSTDRWGVLKAHLKTKVNRASRLTCFHCGWSTELANKSRLEIHMRRHFPGDYKCELCAYRGHTTHELETHMRHHTGDKPFGCHLCYERFVQMCFLQKHLITHKVRSHRCPRCKFAAGDIAAVNDHIKSVHTDDKKYECPECDFQAPHPDSLRPHFESAHGKTLDKLKCRFCDFSTAHSTTLIKHEVSHTGRKWACDKCSYVASDKFRFKQHTMTHTGERPHGCTLCDYRSNSRGGVSRHMVVHSDFRPFKCSMCDQTFKTKQTARLHENTTHELLPKNVRCEDCGYACSSQTILRNHRTIHTGERLFSCSECDYTAAFKSNLAIHMRRIHTAEGNVAEGKHQCKYCNFGSKYLAGLVPHMKACHPDFDLYDCNYCSETFKLKSELTEHERAHLGRPKQPKPKRGPYRRLKCKVCDFETVSLKNLRSHELTHNKRIDCYQCTETFASLESLQEHEKEHVSQAKRNNITRKKCRFCDFTSVGIRRLRLHEWWHIDNDSY